MFGGFLYAATRTNRFYYKNGSSICGSPFNIYKTLFTLLAYWKFTYGLRMTFYCNLLYLRIDLLHNCMISKNYMISKNRFLKKTMPTTTMIAIKITVAIIE